MSQILNSETKSENEIKLIEEKLAQGIFENDSKKLEEDRRKIEERRRETEESRWEAEDELEKIKNVLANLKAEYDVFPSQINNIKEKLKIINQKMDEKPRPINNSQKITVRLLYIFIIALLIFLILKY